MLFAFPHAAAIVLLLRARDGEMRLPVTTLDQLVQTVGRLADYAKIDVQGAELDIPQRGQRLLAATLFIELEVEFHADVDNFLRASGFILLGLRCRYWRRRATQGDITSASGGQVIHGEALYYNQTLLGSPITTTRLVKWLTILRAYRQHDFILRLLSRPHEALTALGPDERLELARALVPSAGAAVRLGRWLAQPVGDRLLRKVITDLRSPVGMILSSSGLAGAF